MSETDNLEQEVKQASEQDSSKSVLKRFMINVASLFSVQVANFLIPLLTVPYIVRIIGPERLGLLNFSQAYIAYFTLLINYGFEMSAVRNIAGKRNDTAQTDRIFSEVLAGKFLLWLVSTVMFVAVTLAVPDFKDHLWLHICTYITCIGSVLAPFWIYQAMEDLGRVAVFNLAVKIIFSASVLLLIRQPDDYIYQNLMISISQVLVNMVALGVAIKRFKLKFTWPTQHQLVGRFKEDSTLFFSSIMITLYASSAPFFLGIFTTPYDVGIFSAGTRLEGIARSFVALALNQAFFPVVASAFGKGRDQGLRVVQMAFTPLILLMVSISVTLWLIAPIFITLFYGDKFTDAITVLRIVSLLPIIISASNLLGLHTMLNLRMDKAFFIITAIGSVIGLILNVVMINQIGYIGAAWAWVLAELYIVLTMYGYLRYKKVPVISVSSLRETLALGKGQLRSFLAK